jgi:hypothetical protein
MDRSKSIRVTEQELFEIAQKARNEFHKYTNDYAYVAFGEVIERQFELLRSMEREPSSWYWKHTNKLFIFAGAAWLFLTAKIFAEYLGAK